MGWRMPIARRNNCQTMPRESGDVTVQRLDHPIAVGNRQRAAFQEIILHIDDDQRVTDTQFQRLTVLLRHANTHRETMSDMLCRYNFKSRLATQARSCQTPGKLRSAPLKLKESAS